MISLTNSYELIPDGTYVFLITEAYYEESSGKLMYTMKTSKDLIHYEYFTLLDRNGQPNKGAQKAFTMFAKCVLDNKHLTEVDHEELVNHYVICNVSHTSTPCRTDPKKLIEFNKLSYIAAASAFEKEADADKNDKFDDF